MKYLCVMVLLVSGCATAPPIETNPYPTAGYELKNCDWLAADIVTTTYELQYYRFGGSFGKAKIDAIESVMEAKGCDFERRVVAATPKKKKRAYHLQTNDVRQ